ncbi:hypothetical protein [Burkholderia sp. MSMB1826]|nr:hypothetical protein [Burkholderia sp. MSMB1826]
MTPLLVFPDIVEQYAAVVARQPSAIAISDAEGALTYAALDRETDAIAQRIAPCLTP